LTGHVVSLTGFKEERSTSRLDMDVPTGQRNTVFLAAKPTVFFAPEHDRAAPPQKIIAFCHGHDRLPSHVRLSYNPGLKSVHHIREENDK
jgi:hypothetical protein